MNNPLRTLWRIFNVGIASLVLIAAGACNRSTSASAAAGAQRPPTPVKIAAVTQENVPVEISTIGRVEAMSTIRVKSQVDGTITQVSFAEGDTVKKDQLLFSIDPRPYTVALQSAEANISKAEAQSQQSRAMTARDKAQEDNAKVELERNTVLLSRGTISKEEFDSSKTNASALEAAVSADVAATKSADEAVGVARAAAEDAKVRLSYCTIKSPIEGKTGSLLVHQGNLVKANDADPLVVINQMKPIYVTFTFEEAKLPQIKTAMANSTLTVRAIVPTEEDKPISGNLTFLDNTVDQTTGTIRFKATFANENDRLWPGQYVNVVLRVKMMDNAIIAPTAAMQVGQEGSYVYVVKPDNTVDMRKVVLGDALGAKTVIADGLKAGEQVVTDGQARLIPGSAVVAAAENAGAKPNGTEASPADAAGKAKPG